MNEFALILIKPSHYDERGYPIVWWKTSIPSNSLAALYGIARDCVERQVLGPEVAIRILPVDETNTHVVPSQVAQDIKRSGARALIGLVGVQSNQYDRALDLAREFRAEGFPVIIGGFHVSGCLSMLKTRPREIQAALDLGCSLFAGECEEGRLDEVLRDAWSGELKPIYNYLAELPGLEGAPVPALPVDALKRNVSSWSSFDLGRGCPFQCSFCTIINVQGRKSRFRTADDLEAIVRENVAHGVKAMFITDDNLARNRHWEEFFDRLIELREKEGLKVNLTIQVDMLCHQIPNFIEKAKRAGVMRVFLGLENINPDNLLSANKRQNRITEYRAMLQEWHKRGVFIFAGYIIGFPADTKDSILRDIDIIKRELPIDVLEFFYLTPLPGSEDHRRMLEAGEWMDPDLNKYNLNNRVSHHARMSDREWEEAYDTAWKTFFTDEHIETVGRRHAARANGRPKKAMEYMAGFRAIYEIERIHPLESGMVRRRRRLSRRPGYPLEPALLFYPRFALETGRKVMAYLSHYRRWKRACRQILSDPGRLSYSDIAIRPQMPDEAEALDLFHETAGGEAYVAKIRSQEARRASARA
ncbi:MAG: B12-binding domain-containing radical SAM protein [Croceibacterium sp.]